MTHRNRIVADVLINFGYWPREWTLDASKIHVEPLPDFKGMVDAIKTSNRVVSRWFYPPLTSAYAPGLDPEDCPSIRAQSFEIRPTHMMRVENETDERGFAEVVIAVLGLLEGIRLIPEGWCHFYRTAIEPHTLSDLVCGKTDIEKVLRVTETFWQVNQAPKVRRGLFGAIHWYLFSQSYEHDFEKFAAQYIVLDSCFKIHTYIHGEPPGERSHSRRASFLARKYAIPEPSWAILQSDKACELSRLRNEFFHEGRYGEHPIGFGHPTIAPPITLQLKAFNARLILGIIGVDCGYVRSRVDTRQKHALDLAR
jgi:hypothetical protein